MCKVGWESLKTQVGRKMFDYQLESEVSKNWRVIGIDKQSFQSPKRYIIHLTT